jgi:glycine betaine/choline ABC-type transport system substrate-binding protein
MEARALGQAVVAVLLTLSIAGAIAGCGGSGSEDATPAVTQETRAEVAKETPAKKAPPEVTLAVRPEGSPEELILGEIYAQALQAAGYKVKKAPQPSYGVTSLDSVNSGQISGYPEHLSTALYYDLGFEVDEIPAKAQAAYKKAKAGFEKKGLTAFPPAPFTLANAVGMLRKTAEERGLKTNTDLKGQAEKMTVQAETYCHLSLDCLGGIEQHYKTAFEAVSYEPVSSAILRFERKKPDLRYEVLEDGKVDASMLYTTEGRLSAEKGKFVILEDDKHVFPAGNVIWVTAPEVVEEAGPDYEKTIVQVQKGLTLPVMQKLDAQVELEKQSPAKVAASYLKKAG